MRTRCRHNTGRGSQFTSAAFIHLKGYAGGREARAGIGEWMAFHDEGRLHQALGDRAPMAVWRAGQSPWDAGL